MGQMFNLIIKGIEGNGKVGKVNNRVKLRHLLFVKQLEIGFSRKNHLCLRMFYDVMNVVNLELVQDGNNYRTIRYCSDKSYCPVR